MGRVAKGLWIGRFGQNFIRIVDFNNYFSGSEDPINVMDSDLGKKIVQIMDSKHNCTQPNCRCLNGHINGFGT